MAALILVSAIGLIGCGGSGSATQAGQGEQTTKAAEDHNDADVTFASHMVLHHQQAVQMSGLAKWQATSPEVKQLAVAITTVQEAQLKQMSGWLTGWGEPVPAFSHSGHDSEDPIPGLLTEDEIRQLGRTKGTMFDRVWIQLMIRHHQGAVAMAKTQQTSGKSPAAIALAKKTITDQTAQIAALKRLLGQLPVA